MPTCWAPTNAASYALACAAGGAGTNYIANSASDPFTISQVALTVTARSATRPFNTPNPDLSTPLSIAGFVNGEAPAVLTTQPTCSTTATILSPVGGHPVTCAGGAAVNYTFGYVGGTLTISAWQLTGFHAPVGAVNTYAGMPVVTATTRWNTIKGGQTVPLKFNLFTAVGGTELKSLSDVTGFALVSLACVPGTEDPVDETFSTPGSTILSYDGTQFHQNWQSAKGANKCYRVTMTARDGSQLSAFFKTK